MRNITNEKPNKKLSGRLKFTAEFVDDKSIKGKTILDIGCGYGWFENYALEKGVKEIYGIEISDEDLVTARENIKSKNVKFSVGGALKLPFKDNYFDTAVAWEVIEHIPENKENQMFKEVNRVLKKEGEFYLSTPNAALFSKYLDPAFYLVSHRHYDLISLIHFGEINRLYLEKAKILGSLWTSVVVLNFYISKWILRRKPLFDDFFRKKETDDYKKDGFYNIFAKFKKI